MQEESILYDAGGTSCKGYLIYDDTSIEKRPGILIAHAWRGLDDFVRLKGHELAKLGYVVFAADVYGDGKRATNDNEAFELMSPLFVDRALLQERIKKGLEKLKESSVCDTTRVGAIGFCFGGLTVIELLRSGAPVNGVVSFHGVLGNEINGLTAKTVPIADNIQGSLLALHGSEDPLVSLQDIQNLEKEMTEAKVDWQFYTYGQTSHAFTNPNAQGDGMVYNPRTAARAWKSMISFFKELFQRGS